ncbi:hypothetical protein BH23VER1_BH23VER1_23850 [soil metagenome]
MKILSAALLVWVIALGIVGAQEEEVPRAVPVDPSASPAAVAAPPTESEEGPATVAFWDIVEQGGIMIYPLAGLSFIAMALVVLYFMTIRQGAVVSDRFMATAESLIRKQDYLGLLSVCNRTNESIDLTTQNTLDFATKNPTASFEEVREVTISECTRQASLLHQRITYLADVGAIAPMVGLLGTVIGMIKSFNEIAQDSFVGAKQIQLAGGVSEALITTAGGLVIGIPALIFYSIFRGRVQRLIAEMEAAATHLMALLAAQYKRATARAASTGRAGRRDPQYALGHEKLDPQGL